MTDYNHSGRYWWRAAWMLAAGWALAGSLASAAQSPPSVEEVLRVPEVTQSMPAPGGGIAWVERVGGTENIFFADGGRASQRLTDFDQDDGEPILMLGFLNHPLRVLFQRGSLQNPANLPDPPAIRMLTVAVNGGGVSSAPASLTAGDAPFVLSPDAARITFARGNELWLMAADGSSEAQRLLSARSRVGGLEWSSDGRRIAYVVDRSDAGRGDYGFVAVVDLATRRSIFLAPGLGADRNPVWSADGGQVGFIREGIQPKTWRFEDTSRHAPFSLIVANAVTGEAVAQWRAPQGWGNHFSAFTGTDEDVFSRGNLFLGADGRWIFPWERTGFRALYAWRPGSDAEPARLTDARIEVDGVAQSPDGTQFVYWAPSRKDPERLDLYRVGPGTLPLKPAYPGTMRYAAQFLDDNRLVWREASERDPEHLRAGAPDAPGERLSSKAPAAEQFARLLGTAQTFELDRPGGIRVHAILYRSLQAPAAGNAPLIVHAHGGSRDKAYPVWQTFFGYPPVLRYFLTRGFHVLSINYRSGTGYGLAFREPARYGAKGNDDVDDFIAVARYAAQHHAFIDPTRMIAYGHSYGGHIVATALARSDVFAAGVDSAGVGDWVYEMQSDSGAPLPLNLPERLEVERMAWRNSAPSQLDRWGHEPILFLHGDADASAALRQTIELYQQLERRGQHPEVVVFPGEAHALRLMSNQRRYILSMESFFKAHGLWPEVADPAAAPAAAAAPRKH